MNRSKILRSIVVAIFALLISYIIFLGFGTASDMPKSTNIIKIAYVIMLVVFTYIYEYIKSKFSKKKIKRKINLTYRYIYMIIITIFSKLFYIKTNIEDDNMYKIVISLLFFSLITVVIKKIIYNISKSDILSVFGAFIYALYPVISLSLNNLLISCLVSLSTLIVIFMVIKLIDELKQIGIKNNKYMVYSFIISILITISLFVGVNSLVWILGGIMLFVIANNLDNSNLNFPNKIISKVPQSYKERLYKIERIYLSKLLISIIFIFVVVTIIYNIVLIFNLDNITDIRNNVFISIKNIFTTNINIVFNNFRNIVDGSTIFYLVICIYILIIEILTVLLRRKYDTKSTFIKNLFVCVFIIYSIYNINLILYHDVLIALITIIAVISTSNLYLNREERIKLLKS